MKPITFKKWLETKLHWIAYTLEGWAHYLHNRAENIEPAVAYELPEWLPLFQKTSITIFLAMFVTVSAAWASSLSVSVVDTQGNTETQTVSVDAEHEIESDDKRSRQELKAGLLYGENDSKRTSESWYGSIKDLHYMAPEPLRWFWFNLSGVEADKFAGYKLRLSFNMGLGIDYTSPARSHNLKLEAGPGLIYEEKVNGDDGYISARGYQEYTWHITESIKFTQNVEYLVPYDDTDNYRVNAEAGFTGRINDYLSLKIGPKVRYVNKPPEGKERTDTITGGTIIFNF